MKSLLSLAPFLFVSLPAWAGSAEDEAFDTAIDELPTRTETMAGFRTGVAGSFAIDGSPATLASSYVDLRHRVGTAYVRMAPGLLVTVGDAPGGLALDLGAGLHLSDTKIVPYVEGGVSSRLLFEGESAVGVAPYASFGLLAPIGRRTAVFGELRAAQNVMPVDDEYRFEPGAAFGVYF